MDIETIDIEEFNKQKNTNVNRKIIVYELITIFFIVGILCALFLIKKKLFYENNLMFINGKCWIIVDEKHLEKILDGNNLYISNKLYQYKLMSQSHLDTWETQYQIYVDIDFKPSKENSVVNYQIRLGEETLFNYLFRRLSDKN